MVAETFSGPSSPLVVENSGQDRYPRSDSNLLDIPFGLASIAGTFARRTCVSRFDHPLAAAGAAHEPVVRMGDVEYRVERAEEPSIVLALPAFLVVRHDLLDRHAELVASLADLVKEDRFRLVLIDVGQKVGEGAALLEEPLLISEFLAGLLSGSPTSLTRRAISFVVVTPSTSFIACSTSMPLATRLTISPRRTTSPSVALMICSMLSFVHCTWSRHQTCSSVRPSLIFRSRLIVASLTPVTT